VPKRVDGRRLEFSMSSRIPAPHNTKKSVGPVVTSNRTGLRRPRAVDDKLAALRVYRRARGLYHRCTEKWSRDHQCPSSV
jgi:hypothetical protein